MYPYEYAFSSWENKRQVIFNPAVCTLRARGQKSVKALEDVHAAGVVTYRIFQNKLGIIALCVFINLEHG